MTTEQEMIETLNKQAKEIADAGFCGWGNTMIAAADCLQHRQAEIDRLREALTDYMRTCTPTMEAVKKAEQALAKAGEKQ